MTGRVGRIVAGNARRAACCVFGSFRDSPPRALTVPGTVVSISKRPSQTIGSPGATATRGRPARPGSRVKAAVSPSQAMRAPARVAVKASPDRRRATRRSSRAPRGGREVPAAHRQAAAMWAAGAVIERLSPPPRFAPGRIGLCAPSSWRTSGPHWPDRRSRSRPSPAASRGSPPGGRPAWDAEGRLPAPAARRARAPTRPGRRRWSPPPAWRRPRSGRRRYGPAG